MATLLTLPFDHSPGPQVLFGPDRGRDLGACVGRLVPAGATVMVVSDPGVHGAGLTARVMAPLEETGFKPVLFTDVRSDPTAASVDAIVARARSLGAAAIVGLGGGSALDAAKLAATIALEEPAAADYALGAIPLPTDRLPMVMIPTTAGTGSEVTKTVVYSLDDNRKVWAWGPELLPDIALLDPTLTVGLPAHLTAATGVDALVHAIEAVTAKTPSAMGETFGLQAIKMAARSLVRAVEEPGDLDARGEMLVASMLAGKAIAECGTGVAHAVGHALGADAHVHHGRAVGLVLRAAFSWNASESPERFDGVATSLGVPTGAESLERAQMAAAAFDRLVRVSGVAVSLRDAGLSGADAERIAQKTLDPENLPMCENNVRPLTPEDVGSLVREVLTAA
ncbi:MAG: iron-containing alcohol dehydrogenase [Alphaproteobacteria bacterium]|nr:iron-containing alcohol dehydrogenase [Alphaproteobacteria bacterium]